MAQQIIIQARRTSYSPNDVRNTMTAREVIECLENFDGDSLVYLSHDNGYTYGGITNSDIDCEEIEDEDDDFEDE
jgi:hypothetical protein